MKKIYYNILFIVGACLAFAACSTGDYNANISSAANNSINPLDPLDSAQLAAYVTSGTPSFMTASINGSPWSSGDSATGWFLNDTTGTNVIAGVSGGQGLVLFLANVYAVNIYKMGYNDKVTYGQWVTVDTGAQLVNPLYSYYSYLGNSGEVQILENDPVAIRGTFYFQGINSTGSVINVTNGYFYVLKN